MIEEGSADVEQFLHDMGGEITPLFMESVNAWEECVETAEEVVQDTVVAVENVIEDAQDTVVNAVADAAATVAGWFGH